MSLEQVYIYAMLANIFFAGASIGFSFYAKKFGVIWMNFIKIFVATLFFLLVLPTINLINISPFHWLILILSGIMGLTFGDLLLLKAYVTLGPGRTQILFSFKPFILGGYAYLFLAQDISSSQLLSIICMLGCLFIFVHERMRETGSWDFKSFFIATLAIVMDSLSMVLTREVFESYNNLDPMQVNFIRLFGALLGFIFIYLKTPTSFTIPFKEMKLKKDYLIYLSSFFGTFLSLYFYLSALKFAHLATFAAIGVAGPILGTIFELIYLKKWPSRHLMLASVFFVCGFYLMYK